MKPSRPATPLPSRIRVEPDKELWFADGNLVLVARDVEFRVYQGPLAAHSPIFKDMLSLPQPGESETGSHSPTFDEVSACIRLGHKYQIDHLVTTNMDFLRKFYTDSFEDWYPSNFVRPPTFQAIHSIGVVNLARLVGADRMLPAALMDCCTLGAEIVRGLPRPDGGRETLAPDDLGRCFVGRTRMAQASARIAHHMFRQKTAVGCRNPTCCARVLQRLLNELANAKDDVISCVDWYASWMVYVDGRDEGRELCIKCYRMLEGERPKVLQREVWEKLPSMMGVDVPGWADSMKQEV
ncbi:uncharacterized protein BXZ73DRAFT_103130 [Epithele typhae]|uniref:uncharacterized protein n=1 Tax=Epithele typhae TaxID=378194 RepID=UPI00200762AF|nr:uncharacterized protein BXZ73DRAFT_103130 [Epithele typhae]KAH9925593.1 hypothetical protein BXZ73DRAFT_103130 [Epithele typhae]